MVVTQHRLVTLSQGFFVTGIGHRAAYRSLNKKVALDTGKMTDKVAETEAVWTGSVLELGCRNEG